MKLLKLKLNPPFQWTIQSIVVNRKKSNNIRIPQLVGIITLTGLDYSPRRSQTEGQLESNITVAFFSSRTAFSSPQSFLARGQFFWFQLQHPHSLPASPLPRYFSPPTTGDLPAARPTATRTLHAKTLVSFFTLLPFLAAALQTQPGNTTQQARGSPEQAGPRALRRQSAGIGFLSPLAPTAAARRRQQGRSLRPPPLLRLSLFNNVSLPRPIYELGWPRSGW